MLDSPWLDGFFMMVPNFLCVRENDLFSKVSEDRDLPFAGLGVVDTTLNSRLEEAVD